MTDGVHRNDLLQLMDSIYQRMVRLLTRFLVFHFSLAYIGERKT